jgi:hypothetical protein
MIDQQVAASALGFSAIHKNSPPIALSGQRAEETFPKTATYCHLLRLSMVERIERPSD